jgi:hypothetical protein
MTGLTRRGFLKVAGVAGLALTSGCSAVGSGAPLVTAEGGGLQLEAPGAIEITSTGELFLTSYRGAPSVDQTSWRLSIDGLVENPLTLTYDQILAYPKVEAPRTLECIGNPPGGGLIGNPIWGGFEAQRLWETVGIKPEARRARLVGADGFETAVDNRWITQPGVLMIHQINGEPLPEEHGFPLRILIPGLYGQKMPKWLTRVEFIAEDFLGTWERQGWSNEASVRTNSLMQQPEDRGSVGRGPTPVYGIAFAGLRRITAVEVRIDEGDWIPAELVQDASPLVWTQWSFEWEAAAGTHTLAVRATDETGFVQGSAGAMIGRGAFPDGADGVHQIVVTVRG